MSYGHSFKTVVAHFLPDLRVACGGITLIVHLIRNGTVSYMHAVERNVRVISTFCDHMDRCGPTGYR